MIVTRPDIGFLRTDDDFILRFLRARKFDQVETFRLLAQYFQFRQQNLDMFQSFKVCFYQGVLVIEVFTVFSQLVLVESVGVSEINSQPSVI